MEIVNSAFGSGGGVSTSTGTSLHSTIGQTFTGMSQNDSYFVGAGFWYAVQSSTITSGMYVYRIQAGNHITTRRMILLK